MENNNSAETEDDGDESTNGWIGFVILTVIIVALFATNALSFTTRGCTLPIDLVLGGEYCLLGSLGGSLVMSIAATLLTAFVFWIVVGGLKSLFHLVKSSRND